MTTGQFAAFSAFRSQFKNQIEIWAKKLGAADSGTDVLLELADLQRSAARLEGTPDYPLETSLVYNRSLDDITQDSDIKLIVIGDNPGKDEQRAKNRRYLVGQAGKIADGFFKRNPEFGIDFRKNVIILNKTPIHTAKTKQLSYLQKNGSDIVRSVLRESQIWMAERTAQLHIELNAQTHGDCATSAADCTSCGLWLVGYAELREKGLFTQYRDTLAAQYRQNLESNAAQSVFVFQHFSMNRFSIDLAQYRASGANTVPITQAVQQLGLLHRLEILGF